MNKPLHLQKIITNIPFDEEEEVPFDEYVTDDHRKNIRLRRLQSNNKNSLAPLDEKDELNMIEPGLLRNSFFYTRENNTKESKINDNNLSVVSPGLLPGKKTMSVTPTKSIDKNHTNPLTIRQDIINSSISLPQENTISQIRIFPSPLLTTRKTNHIQTSPMHSQPIRKETSINQTFFFSSPKTLETCNTNHLSPILTKLNDSTSITSPLHLQHEIQALTCSETLSMNVEDELKLMRSMNSLGNFDDDELCTVMELSNKVDKSSKEYDSQLDVLDEEKSNSSYDTIDSEDTSTEEEDPDLICVAGSDESFHEHVKEDAKSILQKEQELVYSDDSHYSEDSNDSFLSSAYSVPSTAHPDIIARAKGILKRQGKGLSIVQPPSPPQILRKILSTTENNTITSSTSKTNRSSNTNGILQPFQYDASRKYRTKVMKTSNPTSNDNTIKKRVSWSNTMTIRNITTKPNYKYIPPPKKLKRKGHVDIKTFTSVKKEQTNNDNSPIYQAGIRILSAHAITLQTHIRCYISRCQYIAMSWGICILQSYIRRFLSQIHVHVLIHHTKTVQRVFRGWLGRDIFADWNFCAMSIQTAVRRFLVGKRCQRRKKSCVLFQCVWRRHASNLLVMTYFWSFIVIQSFFRGMIVCSAHKKKNNSIMIIQQTWNEYQTFNNQYRTRHIVKLQSAWRGYSSQIKVQFLLVDILLIQCQWRKKKARFYAHTLRVKVYTEMSIRIQTCVRKYLHWNRHRKYLSSTNIQSFWRKIYYYVEYIYTLAKIVMMQQNMRKWQSRKQYLILQHIRNERCKRYAIQMLQTLWKGYSSQLNFITKLMHILLIQSIIRRYIHSKYCQSLTHPWKAANTIQSFLKDIYKIQTDNLHKIRLIKRQKQYTKVKKQQDDLLENVWSESSISTMSSNMSPEVDMIRKRYTYHGLSSGSNSKQQSTQNRRKMTKKPPRVSMKSTQSTPATSIKSEKLYMTSKMTTIDVKSTMSQSNTQKRHSFPIFDYLSQSPTRFHFYNPEEIEETFLRTPPSLSKISSTSPGTSTSSRIRDDDMSLHYAWEEVSFKNSENGRRFFENSAKSWIRKYMERQSL